MDKGQFAGLLFQTFTKLQKHDVTLRAAALTFFIVLPLPSFALIAVAILAQIYGQAAAMQQLVNQVSSFAGPTVANLLSQLLLNAQSPLTGLLGSFLAIVFVLLGIGGAFSVLQKSIDNIWEIQAEQRGRGAFLKEKLLPFSFIIVLGAIVVGWTAVSSVLFGVVVFVLNPILGGFTSYLIWVLEVILSFSLGTLLFAITFKQLPETKVEWRDVWLAAGLTAAVFTVLNYVFGLYLSLVQVTTLAGTAGALIVLFIWIFLMNLFILFGVQFSKVYAQAFGSHHNKSPVLKWPPLPVVEGVEVRAEVSVKVQHESNKTSVD